MPSVASNPESIRQELKRLIPTCPAEEYQVESTGRAGWWYAVKLHDGSPVGDAYLLNSLDGGVYEVPANMPLGFNLALIKDGDANIIQAPSAI